MMILKKSAITLITTQFFALSLLYAQVTDDINQFPVNPIEAITEISIKAPIEKSLKLVKAGKLNNIRVIYASAKATDEEKQIAKENNKIYQNYEKEIESAERAIRREELPEELKYYTYTIKKEDISNGKGLNQIIASLDQRQGTFATANGFSSPEDLKPGMTVILPIFQGLFIAENPENDFEILLKKEYESEIENSKTESSTKNSKDTVFSTSSNKTTQKSKVKKVEIEGKKYNYLPGKSISPTAKAFFDSQKQNDKMILPLSRKVLTSPFGYRTSPISGKWKLHAGIDLAAPTGTDVFACKSGKVIESGYNEIYGNYIIIRHEDKKTSTYAHLSKRLVEINVTVKTGAVIGKVGTTGASTGPHLHFEIRENGKATDPTKFL